MVNREAERKRLVELLRHDCYKEDGELHCASCVYDSEEDCSHHELADYLLDNGIVVPPVKVGQTIYQVTRNFISEFRVRFIEISTCENVFLHTDLISGIILTGEVFPESEIGKTVFTSREDAVKALRGDEGK